MVQFIGKRVQVPQREDGLGSIFSTLAAPLMNTLQNDLRRAQLTGMEAEQAQKARQQAALTALADDVSAPEFDPRRAARNTVLSGYDPQSLGRIHRIVATNVFGHEDPRAVNAAIGGGEDYQKTFAGAQAGFANQRAIQAQQEATKMRIEAARPYVALGPDGLPVVTTQGQAPGMRASVGLDQVKGAAAQQAIQSPGGLAGLDPTTRTFVGAGDKDRTPYVATLKNGTNRTVFSGPNGIVDSQTGQTIPQDQLVTVGRLEANSAAGFQSADPVERQIYDRRFATAQVTANIDDLISSLSKPDAGATVGWAGSAATMFNNLRAQFEATAGLFGGGGVTQESATPEVAQSLDGAVKTLFGDARFNSRAQQLGIDTAIVRSQIQNLAYAIAKANDPSGRMSDRDVVAAMGEIGGSLGDPVAMQAVLMRVRERAIRSQKIYEDTFAPLVRNRSGAPGAPAPTPQVPTQPAPQTPPPAPTGPQTVQTSRGTVTIRRLD